MEMGGDAALQSGADVEAVVVSWLRNIEAVFKIMVSCAGARSPMEGGGGLAARRGRRGSYRSLTP